MKKLLLLGGARYLLPVIKTAHALGLYVITCDYLPDNYAHRYADAYYNVSIIDKEAVLQLAKELAVDGIMSFACDPGVETMAYVCEKLGLPCVGSYEAVLTLQDKVRFRDFLRKNGFNVPHARGFSACAEFLENAAEFHFPVIVKPADSAGSKGVTRLDSTQDAAQAIERALAYSKTKRFIVEEFIEKQGDSSDCDCFSVNGKMVFVSFSNQKFDPQAINPYTPAGYTWPPQMPAQAQAYLAAELDRVCKLLGLGSSVYNVETRVGKDGKAYIMEMSPRGGGNRLSEMMRYVAHTDLIEQAILAALGEPCKIEAMPHYEGYWYEYILHAETAGVFVEVQIDEALQDNVVEKDLWVCPGDSVNAFTGANQTIGTLVFRFASQNQLEAAVQNSSAWIRVVTR